MTRSSRRADAALLNDIQSYGVPIQRSAHDDQLYRFNGTHWDRKGDDDAQRRLTDLYGDTFSAGQLRAVRYLLRGIPPSDVGNPIPQSRYLINVMNGTIDVAASPRPKLRPHSPDDMFTYVLPHEYDPNASCPNIDEALEGMFPDPDMVALLHEIFGYCLLPGVNFKKAVLFHSRLPHTGKSTILNLIGALVGHANEATVSLQDLDDHRFARASLQGKLVNRSGDLGAYAPRTSTVFKSLVGGDPVLAEHKGQAAFTLHNTAKLLFAGNSFAGTHEQGAAYTTRWLVVPFTVVHEPNPGFLDRLTTPDEMRGLLRHAVNGAARLAMNNRFTEAAPVALAEQQLRLETDSVSRYAEEVLTHDPTGECAGAQTYNDYVEWAKESNLRPVGRPGFYSRLTDMPGVEIVEGNSRRKIIRGLRVDYPTAPEQGIVQRWKKNG